MNRLFSALIIFILLFSCTEEKVSIRKNVLQLKSPHSCYVIKQYQEEQHTYYYTYDLNTRKIINIYNEKGKLYKEIKIRKFGEEHACEFFDVTIVNPKRVIFLSKDNQIYITNLNLHILKHFTFFNYLHQGLRFAPSTNIRNNEMSVALLASWPDGVSFDSDSLSNAFLHSQPIIATIDLNNGNIKPLGTGIINRLLSPRYEYTEGIHYNYPTREHCTYVSAFTDTIYHISEAGKVTPVIKTESKCGKVNCPPMNLDQIRNDMDFVRNTFISNTFLYETIYDKFRNLNYLILRRPRDNFKEFPFNLLIYDANWKKLDELEFKGNTYRMNFLVTNAGLLIERANNNSENRKFDCLTYKP